MNERDAPAAESMAESTGSSRDAPPAREFGVWARLFRAYFRLLVLQYHRRVLGVAVAMAIVSIPIGVFSFVYLGGMTMGGFVTGWLVYGAMLLPIASASCGVRPTDALATVDNLRLHCVASVRASISGLLVGIAALVAGWLLTLVDMFVSVLLSGLLKAVASAEWYGRNSQSGPYGPPNAAFDIFGIWPNWAVPPFPVEDYRARKWEWLVGAWSGVMDQSLLLIPAAAVSIVIIAVITGYTMTWSVLLCVPAALATKNMKHEAKAREKGACEFGRVGLVVCSLLGATVAYPALFTGRWSYEELAHGDFSAGVTWALVFVMVAAPIAVSGWGAFLSVREGLDGLENEKTDGPDSERLSLVAWVWIGFAGLLLVAGLGTWWYLGPYSERREIEELRKSIADGSMSVDDRVAAIETLVQLAPEGAEWAQVAEAIVTEDVEGIDRLPSRQFDLGSDWVLEVVYIGEGSIPRAGSESARRVGPFWLGKTEVTQGQWQAIMNSNPSNFRGDPSRPVENVSAADAMEFCRRLSLLTGRNIRLPSPSEWEYACRAGASTRYSFGDDESMLPAYAWFGNNFLRAGNSGDSPHPVAEKLPNRWGLFDMHGNVQEWTMTSLDAIEARGGCWHHGADQCVSDAVVFDSRDARYSNVGVRILVDPDGE